ncbi:unnamed protein product [Ascophyllum nodosum]
MVITCYSKSKDKPGKVANPARGRLRNRENEYFPVPVRAREFGLARRVRQSRPACQPAHLHAQVESGAYLRDSSRSQRRCPFLYLNRPYAIGSLPSLSGHAIAYRWHSLPRVRWHRASKPQGCSKQVLPWKVTIDQSICTSISHTHYWYELSTLKVPACCIPVGSTERFLTTTLYVCTV